MDSLTQIALGAAIGEATLGRKAGHRAMLWGAVCGTLPDLDVFIPMGDAVQSFTYHRSFSHSLFVLAAITPLLAWLILKLHPQTAAHRRGWLWLVLLALGTHPLLDSFTVYGTQLFWPFHTTPMSWSTIFIIDPLYTVPLLVGVICALVARRESNWGRRMNAAGLALSSLYLVWTVGAKLHVEQVARESLARRCDRDDRPAHGPGTRICIQLQGGRSVESARAPGASGKAARDPQLRPAGLGMGAHLVRTRGRTQVRRQFEFRPGGVSMTTWTSCAHPQ